MGVGIYGKTLYFFDPLSAKKPRNFLGFLGVHLFCTTLLEGLCKKDAVGIVLCSADYASDWGIICRILLYESLWDYFFCNH